MSESLIVRVHLLFLAALLLLAVATEGQGLKGNFSSMVAAGKVNGDAYENPLLGLTLSAPKAKWEVRGPISNQSRQGRLIDASYDVGVPERGPKENYTLGLLVESQENYPKGTTLEQYVRGLRQRVEDENVRIYRGAFPLTEQDVPFVGTVFRFFERSDFGYYRGLYSANLNGYFITIEVQCGSEERLQKLLSSALKIAPGPKH